MNSTNETMDYEQNPYLDLFQKLVITAYTFTALFIVLGICLNGWLLCAIATSADLRVSMRNKLIISTSVLHLIECCTKLPLFYAIYLTDDFDCHAFAAYVNIDLIEDFACSLILVEMIALYLCQIMDLKISEILSILGQRIVTISFLMLPWVASLITVPAMIHSDRWGIYDCFIPKSLQIFKCIDSIVPLILSITLLVVAIVKKRNRYREGFSASNMQVELISRGPELDETSAYVVAIAVSILCEILGIIQTFKYSNLIFAFCALIMERSRVVIMVLPWLIFKDIRARVKTWRPWYRPSPGIDLTVAYGIGQDEQTNNTGQP